jgi:hypothetical protein
MSDLNAVQFITFLLAERKVQTFVSFLNFTDDHPAAIAQW